MVKIFNKLARKYVAVSRYARLVARQKCLMNWQVVPSDENQFPHIGLQPTFAVSARKMSSWAK